VTGRAHAAAKACRRVIKDDAGRGRELSKLRDRHCVTDMCSALSSEGTEREAGADDDGRKDHANSALDFVGNCKHGDLLDLFSNDVRVVAGLALRLSRVLQGYTSNAIAGEQRRNTGGRASGYASVDAAFTRT